MIFDNKNILITGGTGSFGKSFAEYLLNNTKANKVVAFSRDEMKHWECERLFDHYRYRGFIGDIRDNERLQLAFRGIDYVVHAAAMKIVHMGEYNPSEFVKTNVSGALNVLDAARSCGVQQVIALSTDKACAPVNLYGASKLMSDKIFVAGNAYSGEHGPKSAVVRYGNVMGSRGSVIPFFRGIDRSRPLPVTSVDMTRFMVTMDQAIRLVEKAFSESQGGEIFVTKAPSTRILDIVEAIRGDRSDIEIVGLRPGEKIHEQMIVKEDAYRTYEFRDYFKILPDQVSWAIGDLVGAGTQVGENFQYSSEVNVSWLSPSDIQSWMSEQLASQLGDI